MPLRSSSRAASASAPASPRRWAVIRNSSSPTSRRRGSSVLTEAAVLDLVAELARARGMATLLVTHNLALAAARCHRIVVMHAGQIVESAPSRGDGRRSASSLCGAIAGERSAALRGGRRASVIPGQIPDLTGALAPCRFSSRCSRHQADCDNGPLPTLRISADHLVSCRHPLC